MNNFSDNEDDPPVYESSGSEWNSSSEYEPRSRKRNNRRSTRNNRRKSKISDTSTSDSDIDDPKPRKRNGFNKKQKVEITPTPTTPTVQSSPPPVRKTVPTTPINLRDYSTGSFLINRKDAQVGDPNKHPCIWRVDGKALLQKFEPFEEDGKVRHRTTSVYTGWSALDRDQYAPVTVTVKEQKQNQTIVVEVNWEKLKEITINMDSD